MPSPWLMARASGFYCRVFVPADLRPVLGQRFLVRALDARDRDEARLIAARIALAAGDLYRQLRRELTMAEPKVSDVIASVQSGKARELIIRGLRTPSGASVDEVQIDNADDARLFKEQFGDVFSRAASDTGGLLAHGRPRRAHIGAARAIQKTSGGVAPQVSAKRDARDSDVDRHLRRLATGRLHPPHR